MKSELQLRELSGKNEVHDVRRRELELKGGVARIDGQEGEKRVQHE